MLIISPSSQNFILHITDVISFQVLPSCNRNNFKKVDGSCMGSLVLFSRGCCVSVLEKYTSLAIIIKAINQISAGVLSVIYVKQFNCQLNNFAQSICFYH